MIRDAHPDDLQAVLDVHRRAFGQETEAILTRNLLADPSAEPRLSILAEVGGQAVGHVLFTSCRVEGPAPPPTASLLAPLAVVPEAQFGGHGTALVNVGFARLQAQASSIVFVLGDPAYYGRFGFEPAWLYELSPPHPLPDAYRDAWMVRQLRAMAMPTGRVRCAEAISDPVYWRD